MVDANHPTENNFRQDMAIYQDVNFEPNKGASA